MARFRAFLLLRRLAGEGRTVFVSSHILAEVEQVCDRVAILARGRCVTHGTVDEVVATAGHRSAMLVKVDDLLAGEDAVRRARLPVERVDGALRVRIDPSDAGCVTRLLADAGQWVTELRPDRFSLEDVFLELTASPEEVAA